jgi:hypothetical protein
VGGLHIEMAVLRMLGHWLDGPRWIHCLVQAHVATSCVADSFLHGNHVKRARYSHTVTAATLFICRHQSNINYCEELNTPLSFDEFVLVTKNLLVSSSTGTQYYSWNRH